MIEHPSPSEAPFQLVHGEPPEAASQFRCPLCGARFTHGRRVCALCPIGAACHLVSCPRCGHAFPRSSRTLDWLRRILGRRRETP